MTTVIQLSPYFPLQEKGGCRSASCDQGSQKASLELAGCVDTLHLFVMLLGRIKHTIFVQ